jgi:hypothetical protein
MSPNPRCFLLASSLLLLACHREALRSSTSEAENDPALWAAVQQLSSEAQSLLRQQEELIWKNWTEGAPLNLAKTYEGKERLFSRESIQTVDRLRRRVTAANGCSTPPPGLPAECPKNVSASLHIKALTYLQLYLAGEYLARALSEQTEAIANLEASMSFSAAGKEYPYRDLEKLLAGEKNPEKRQALYNGATRAVERLSQSVQRKEQKTDEVVKELGFPSYQSFGAAIRYQDLDRTAQLAEQLLTLTQQGYAQAMEQLAMRELQAPLSKLRRSDIPRLFRSENLQSSFPKEALLAKAKATLSSMGIDLAALTAVTIDVRPLPKKNPRPLTVAISVPDDVRISLKPAGGVRDQSALLQELGHALPYAFTRDPPELAAGKPGTATLHFELTKLGSGNLDQAYALLFDGLCENPEWLREPGGVNGDKLQSHLLARKVYRLYQLRHRAGRLLYALQSHRSELQEAKGLYSQIMSRAYGFSMSPEEDGRYLVDSDEIYQSADELQAWALASQLQATLIKRFGTSWWKNQEAGVFLRQLWTHGNAIYPQELAQLLGETTLKAESLLQQAIAVSEPAQLSLALRR